MSGEENESTLRYTKLDREAANIEGWVVKEGKKLKQAKPRYLRLRNKKLSNHKDEDGTATWSVSVVDCTVGPGTRKNELVVELPKRRVSFFMESTREFEKWIFALKKASSSNVSVETFYRLGEVVGEGINGDVVKGWDRATNETVAIKSIPYDGDLNEQNDVAAEKEIEIVKSLRHENLVKTFDVFRDIEEGKIYIVMEYVAGGELFARIANDRGNLITEGDAIRVARNILAAVIYLHERNIVHRDIKLENVLCVDADEHKPIQVKLADFGLSSKLSGKVPSMQSLVGTHMYLAPEIIERREYGASVDLWACGVLLYICLSGQFPFAGSTEDEYYANVLGHAVEFPEEFWGNVSAEGKDFVSGLLEKDAGKRLTAKEALRHKWVVDGSIGQFDCVEEVEDGEAEEEELLAAPKSIFGGKRKTAAEILAKVRNEKR